MNMLPPIDWLRKHHKKIHFFGLGFIQIKINPTLRFHFYTGRLESTTEEPHNHRYDFTSFILKGELTHRIFRAIPGDTHNVVNVTCAPGDDAVVFPMRWGIQQMSETTMAAGSYYTLPDFVYHQVQSDNCITRVQPETRKKDMASILRKIGTQPTCPFSNVTPEDTLWEIVDDMLKD